MSQQIAEFYAKITADTTQIQQSLTKLHEKLDKTKEKGEKTGGVFAGLKNHIAGLVNPTTLAISGFTALAGVVTSSFGSFQQRADEIRDLSIAMGVTADQASVTKETLADFGVETQDLQVAARALKEKGLSPTIDTLAKLSDQFLAIEDPAERLKFAQDNLGKSYQSYLTALSQGSSVLLKNADAVNKNLILTEEQVKDAMEQKMAIDALSDAWEGFTLQLGAGVGQMVLALNEQKEMNDAIGDYAKEHGIAIKNAGQAAVIAAKIREERLKEAMATFEATQKNQQYNHVLREYAQVAQEEVVPSMQDLQKAGADFINNAIEQTAANRDFQKSQSETMTKIDEYKAQLNELFPWETEKRQEILDQIGELKTKYDEDAAAFTQAMNTKIAMLTIEKIAMLDGVEGFSEGEQKKAMAILETLGTAEAASARQVIAFDAASTALATGELKAKDLDAALRHLQKGYTIDVVLNMIQQATGGWHAQGSSAMQNAGIGGGFAEGTHGWKTVPAGYPSDNYMIGLTSGEQFYVRNHSEVRQGSSAGPSAGAGGDAAMLSTLMTLIQRLPDDIARSNRAMFEKAGRR